MRTPIFCEYSTSSWSNSTARYAPLTSGPATATFAAGSFSGAQTYVLVAGALSRLHARLAGAITQGNYTIELMKNGVGTGLKATIAPGAQLAMDLVTRITVAPGDLLNFSITPTGTPDNDTTAKQQLNVALLFEATVSGKSQNFAYVLSSTSSTFIAPGMAHGGAATLDAAAAYAPDGLTIDALAVGVTTAPGSGNSRSFQIKVGPIGALVDVGSPVVFSGTENGFKTATGLNINVPAGQAYALVETVGGTPAASIRRVSFGTTPGGAGVVIRALENAALSNASERLTGISGQQPTSSTTEGAYYAVAPGPLTIKALMSELSVAPGAGKSRAVVLKKNGADVLTTTVSDTATSATTTANLAVESGALLSYAHRPTGTPANTSYHKQAMVVVAEAPPASVAFTPGDKAGLVWEGVRQASTVKLRGNYSGAPSSIQVRLTDAAGAAVSGFDWAAATFSNGSYQRNLANVPVGGPYFSEVREGTSGTAVRGTAAQFVGAVVVDWGQSQREKIYTAGIGTVAAVSGVKGTVVRIPDQTQPAPALMYDAASQSNLIGSGAMRIINDWWTATGIPIMLVKCNYEGSNIGYFIDNYADPGQQWGRWDVCVTAMNMAENQASVVTFMQGTSDVGIPDPYPGKMDQLKAKFEAQLSGQVPLFGVMPHPRSNDGGQTANIQKLRNLQYQKALTPSSTWRLLAWLLDWQMDNDGSNHQSPGDTGNGRGGARFARGLIRLLYDPAADIFGPTITSAVRAADGTSITVTFDRDIETPGGATTGVVGWFVSADGTTWPLASNADAAITGPRTLRLTPKSGTFASGSRVDSLRGTPFSSYVNAPDIVGTEAAMEADYFAKVITDTSGFDNGRGMPAAPIMGSGFATTEATAAYTTVAKGAYVTLTKAQLATLRVKDGTRTTGTVGAEPFSLRWERKTGDLTGKPIDGINVPLTVA